MTDATFEHLDSSQAFKTNYKKINEIINRYNDGLNIFYELRAIFKLRKIKRGANKLRSEIGNCEKTECIDVSKCLKEYYNLSKLVRDDLVKLINLAKSSRKFQIRKIFINAIEDALIEWDELAEDCLIGADDDIQSLVAKIAKNV